MSQHVLATNAVGIVAVVIVSYRSASLTIDCLGTLAAGEVRYAVEWPGLSAEEKAEGCVLPCVAHPLGDVMLRSPGP